MTTFTTKTDAINYINDRIGNGGNLEIAERVFGTLRSDGRISADDAGLHLADSIDLIAEAAALLDAMTTAQRVALEMGDDGTRFHAPDGRSLHRVCRAHGAEVYRDDQGERSYRFSDGSAIATSGSAWDVVHADCSCLWCWAGGEVRCDEQTGEEYRCTMTDDAAEPGEGMASVEVTPARTIAAAAEGYVVTLTGDHVTISRESGEWAGDGRWENGRIVDCSAHLADDPDESERVYDALETALVDELDETERLEAEAEARYIVVQAPSYDGGLMIARLATGENEDQCARRCGACIRSYGPPGEDRNFTKAEAFEELRRLEEEEAEWDTLDADND
jgi:hypothetical protein